MRSTRVFAPVTIGAALGALCCAPGPDLSAPIGSRDNPVVCAGRPDELTYLARLRCPDGSTPEWQREVDAASGPYGAPLDRYAVHCVGARWATQIHFDRRHRPIEPKAPPEGLDLAPASAAPKICGVSGGCGEP